MEYTVKDLPISYEIHGSGTPIVMIHGWSVDHRLMKGCMEPIFQSLDAAWQRIYFDLPGMGKTKGPAWITGTDQMLELILEFIDGVLPGQHFLLAGESYGGYLARGVLKARQALVDGLLLICPVASQETLQANAPALQVLEKDEAFLNSLSEEDRKWFSRDQRGAESKSLGEVCERRPAGIKSRRLCLPGAQPGAACAVPGQRGPGRAALPPADLDRDGPAGLCGGLSRPLAAD